MKDRLITAAVLLLWFCVNLYGWVQIANGNL